MLCSSELSRLEAGYSARSVREHAEIIDRLTMDFKLSPSRRKRAWSQRNSRARYSRQDAVARSVS